MSVIKVCVLGFSGVGKSSLCIQFFSGIFVKLHDPTVNDVFRKEILIDGESCILEFIDSAGADDFTALTDQWIIFCDGFLIIYDITHRESFGHVEGFLKKIQQIKDGLIAPTIILGNKCDLKDERCVPFQEGESLAKRTGCNFMETSAKSRHNLIAAFTEIARETKNIKNHYPIITQNTRKSKSTTHCYIS